MGTGKSGCPRQREHTCANMHLCVGMGRHIGDPQGGGVRSGGKGAGASPAWSLFFSSSELSASNVHLPQKEKPRFMVTSATEPSPLGCRGGLPEPCPLQTWPSMPGPGDLACSAPPAAGTIIPEQTCLSCWTMPPRDGDRDRVSGISAPLCPAASAESW